MVRAIIMALFLVAVAVIHGHVSGVTAILENKKALTFIALSGIAGASSWLFYFLALKTGPVSQVAPIDKLSVVFAVIMAIILFGEKVTLLQGIAIALIAIGGLILAIC
jgi:transporter family protein